MKAKSMFLVLVLVLLVLCIILWAVGNYFFNYTLYHQGKIDFEKITTEENQDKLWLLNESESVYISSRDDGLRLHGYFCASPKESNMYLIAVHGYKDSAFGMAKYARHYFDNGWNVLVINHRAHGLSEGKYIGMGVLERHDLVKWAQWIVNNDENAVIALHGVSMGAATVMMATNLYGLPSNVRVAIEDCGYANISEEFTVQLKAQFGLPKFPIIPIASLVTKMKAGYFFSDGDCVAALKNSTVPTLFIHGDADTFVPFSMLEQNYEAAACEKEKLIVPGATHAESVAVAPELYWQKVDEFVGKYVFSK